MVAVQNLTSAATPNGLVPWKHLTALNWLPEGLTTSPQLAEVDVWATRTVIPLIFTGLLVLRATGATEQAVEKVLRTTTPEVTFSAIETVPSVLPSESV
jgi:hypothetical protein